MGNICNRLSHTYAPHLQSANISFSMQKSVSLAKIGYVCKFPGGGGRVWPYGRQSNNSLALMLFKESGRALKLVFRTDLKYTCTENYVNYYVIWQYYVRAGTFRQFADHLDYIFLSSFFPVCRPPSWPWSLCHFQIPDRDGAKKNSPLRTTCITTTQWQVLPTCCKNFNGRP